jgi:regulatory protein
MRARPRPSLKARAIGWLAQREHSRSELRRKLLRRARADAAADALARAAGGAESAAPCEGKASAAEFEPAVDQLLDWLEAHDYLSQSRFAATRVHVRAARHGTERIRQELARHGVALDAEAVRALRESELARAQAVWQRKFGSAAPDAAGRAKQARFLAARGFSGEVIRRVVKGLPEG